MTEARITASRAVVQGLWLTVKAPGLMVTVLLVTMLAALPFALVVESEVMESLALQPVTQPGGGSDIDAEWWLEFRRHASGLAATFTPAILGFAAPLDSISALLDGTPRPLALIWPVALTMVVWAFLWGGILDRFASGQTSVRAFVAAGSRHFAGLLMISAGAAAVSVLIYLTLHAVLFDVIYEAMSARLSTERDAFLLRVVFYLIFGSVLLLANAVFSFARIFVVAGEGSFRAIARAWTFVRAHTASIAVIYIAFLLLFGIAMVAYGGLEIAGGSRVGGWRAVVIGQAFIGFRLVVRLAIAASQVRFALPKAS